MIPPINLGPLHCATKTKYKHINCAQCNSFLFFDDRYPEKVDFSKTFSKKSKKPPRKCRSSGSIFSFSRGGAGKMTKMPFFHHFCSFFLIFWTPPFPANFPSTARKKRRILCEKTANFDEKSSKNHQKRWSKTYVGDGSLVMHNLFSTPS